MTVVGVGFVRQAASALMLSQGLCSKVAREEFWSAGLTAHESVWTAGTASR